MSRLSRTVERLTSSIESASVLDPLADAIDSVVSRLPAGRTKDVLSGVALGHPLHPALVAVPIGAFSSAIFLDAFGEPEAARRLIGLGLVSSVPAGLAGLSDWSDTRGAERRVGVAHMAVNTAGLSLLTASWLARRAARYGSGRWLAVTGFGLVGASSWLGGHLAYALGVGVDTTAFLRPPTEWADAIAFSSLTEGQAVAVTVDATPVLLVKMGPDVHAIGDRCTHRGGPLHEGPIVDGCVECPWHQSRFDLTDGSVVRGPATRPAAAFFTRVMEGRVQVRRDEERTLRLNLAP
ncbi:Rieske 2Fe-2S domain-containing protein [Lapillicoccus sp.]|uniref:Rieske 2Fe-2S domain-containing protein n=1 Tax=Lapillicoccus sp. TaxID=1909287 RepID=UPI0027C14CDC|nr:Rieske 2Fe-2S domain-containing protein [Actinomycetota bacterium]